MGKDGRLFSLEDARREVKSEKLTVKYKQGVCGSRDCTQSMILFILCRPWSLLQASSLTLSMFYLRRVPCKAGHKHYKSKHFDDSSSWLVENKNWHLLCRIDVIPRLRLRNLISMLSLNTLFIFYMASIHKSRMHLCLAPCI